MQRRRIAWWFGVPFLVLGVLMWTLRVEWLVWPTFVLFGASTLALAVDGMRTGIVEVKFGTYSRWENPFNFWLHVTVFFVLGAALLVAAGVKILDL
jgi:hypothetical protein